MSTPQSRHEESELLARFYRNHTYSPAIPVEEGFTKGVHMPDDFTGDEEPEDAA